MATTASRSTCNDFRILRLISGGFEFHIAFSPEAGLERVHARDPTALLVENIVSGKSAKPAGLEEPLRPHRLTGGSPAGAAGNYHNSIYDSYSNLIIRTPNY